MLALYGHPFSSYTWKVQIALYANATPFELRIFDSAHPEHVELVKKAAPLGKFPVLADGERLVIEASSIIEYLALKYPGEHPLLPDDAEAAIEMRMVDRVFDNYVMGPLQAIVEEYLRPQEARDMTRTEAARDRLQRAYRWIENWLQDYELTDRISLIECAAAPSLFYGDWVQEIGEDCPLLRRFRAHLLQQPSVARCVEDGRPYRHFFPLGAPDRD